MTCEPASTRLFDRKVHPCGCETAFDTDAWTSVTLIQCDEHREIVAKAVRTMSARDDPQQKHQERRCDHVCLKDHRHVERGEPHFYGYVNPAPYDEIDRLLAELDTLRAATATLPEAPADTRIAEAVRFAADYGWIDGDHHKAWVIDQMLRSLLGESYAEVVGDDWDEGTPP